MSTTETTENNDSIPLLGLGSSAGLGLAPERAEFEDWYRRRSDHYEWMRGLDRALKFGAPSIPEDASRYHEDSTQEAWEGWKAGRAAERDRCQKACAGKRHAGCNYLAQCGTVCNKCGRVA